MNTLSLQESHINESDKGYPMTVTSPVVSTNVVWHNATVTRARREAQNGHRGAIIWFTGLYPDRVNPRWRMPSKKHCTSADAEPS